MVSRNEEELIIADHLLNKDGVPFVPFKSEGENSIAGTKLKAEIIQADKLGNRFTRNFGHGIRALANSLIGAHKKIFGVDTGGPDVHTYFRAIIGETTTLTEEQEEKLHALCSEFGMTFVMTDMVETECRASDPVEVTHWDEENIHLLNADGEYVRYPQVDGMRNRGKPTGIVPAMMIQHQFHETPLTQDSASETFVAALVNSTVNQLLQSLEKQVKEIITLIEGSGISIPDHLLDDIVKSNIMKWGPITEHAIKVEVKVNNVIKAANSPEFKALRASFDLTDWEGYSGFIGPGEQGRIEPTREAIQARREFFQDHGGYDFITDPPISNGRDEIQKWKKSIMQGNDMRHSAQIFAVANDRIERKDGVRTVSGDIRGKGLRFNIYGPERPVQIDAEGDE